MKNKYQEYLFDRELDLFGNFPALLPIGYFIPLPNGKQMSTKIKISSSVSWQVIYYSGYGKWDRLTLGFKGPVSNKDRSRLSFID